MPILCWYVQRSGTTLRNQYVHKCKHKEEDGQETKADNIIPCYFVSHAKWHEHTIDKARAQYILMCTQRSLLFLLVEHVVAQMAHAMPTTCHISHKWCIEFHFLFWDWVWTCNILSPINASWNIPSKFIQPCHSFCMKSQWECTIGWFGIHKVVHYSTKYQKINLENMARGKCMWHKQFCWEAHILMRPKPQHAKLHAQFITLYPMHECIKSHNEA